MSFPDAGQAVPSTGTGNIKFSDLRLSYLSNGSSGGNEGLNDEEGVLKLSFFRGVSFTSGDPIPGEGAISIETEFCGKTFAPEEGEGEPEPESFSITIARLGEYGEEANTIFEGVKLEGPTSESIITHSYTAGDRSVTVLFNHGAFEFIVDEENLSNCTLNSEPTSEVVFEDEPPITTTVSITLIDPSKAVLIPIILN
jgi:hypothetical protein